VQTESFAEHFTQEPMLLWMSFYASGVNILQSSYYFSQQWKIPNTANTETLQTTRKNKKKIAWNHFLNIIKSHCVILGFQT